VEEVVEPHMEGALGKPVGKPAAPQNLPQKQKWQEYRGEKKYPSPISLIFGQAEKLVASL